jgi:phosphorylase kinase alpha/beta subunit
MTSVTDPTHAHTPLGALSASPSVIGAERATLDACYATLDRLRGANGLYLASPSADYSKAWIRDNVYEVLPYADKRTPHYVGTYRSLLDILRRHEYKIDAIIREKPEDRDAYIHARFHPATFHEFDEPWGNKQNDATGALLFGIAEGLKRGQPVLRDARDRRLVTKLIEMHVALEYWHDADNGMWEEGEELHASSVGAVLGGLRASASVGFEVPREALTRGEQALAKLLPRESRSKETDLALLSLLWPMRVVTPEQRRQILHTLEAKLLR